MRRYLALIIFSFCLPILLLAQQKPTFEKTSFVAPDGKLYVQKDLGLYVWLSTSSEESSEKFLLKSELTEKYANPMFLDTDGFNTLRSPSAVDPETRKTVYPIRDIVFEVYADASSPITQIDYNGSEPTKVGDKFYVKANTKITLNAKDALAGVKKILFSIDGKTFTDYTQAITFSEEKEYILKFFSVDNVGNDEEIHEFNFIYDNTPPTSTKSINTDEHDNNIISARSTISLVAEDKGIGVKKIIYKIDDGNEYAYQHPLRAAMLSQGEHSVTYYAVDKVGNSENPQTYTFYIDKTPPTIIEEVIGKSFFANGREFSSGKSQLKLTAFDNKAGVKEIRYSINNGEYIEYTKPVFLTQSSGNLSIKTYAIDNVNNKSTSQLANEKTDIPYIDLSGPTLSHYLIGAKFSARDTLFINSKTKVALKATDVESGVNRIEYSIDGAPSKTFEESFNILEEGLHTISYIGYDNVENTSSAMFTVKIDNTGPIINHQFSTSPIGLSDGKKEYPKYVILFLAGTDNVVGLNSIKYGFNDNATKAYTIPITGFSSGEKSMKFIASDKLGNITEQEIKFDIK